MFFQLHMLFKSSTIFITFARLNFINKSLQPPLSLLPQSLPANIIIAEANRTPIRQLTKLGNASYWGESSSDGKINLQLQLVEDKRITSTDVDERSSQLLPRCCPRWKQWLSPLKNLGKEVPLNWANKLLPQKVRVLRPTIRHWMSGFSMFYKLFDCAHQRSRLNFDVSSSRVT